MEAGESFAEVESTKSVSDIFGPLNGTIAAVNDELESTPDLVNSEPYEAGWLVEIAVEESGELDAQLATCSTPTDTGRSSTAERRHGGIASASPRGTAAGPIHRIRGGVTPKRSPTVVVGGSGRL